MSERRACSRWIASTMTRLATVVLVIGAFATASLSSSPPQRAATTVKALVGGTLIDGFGGPPIRNSVILIEGERITAVGQVGIARGSRRAPR